MQFVGLDIHKNRSSMCILDHDGKVVKEELIKGRWASVLERLRSIEGPWSVCYEASCGYGYLYERLSPMAQHVAVAHPGQLRLIFRSKKKHDRVDSQKLAKLLYLGEVPQVHVPGMDVRQWRKLIEFRQRLLGRRTAVKNQVRAILRGNDVESKRWQWTKKATKWLGELELPAGEKLALDMAVEEIGQFNERIRRVEAELTRIAETHPGIQLLKTIPGVGTRTAEAFLAYVDDIKRFARNRQVGAYFGLVPCLDSSAGRDRLGHITADGPGTVRKLLTEAAWQGVRRDPTIRAYFEQVMRGETDRKKIALVATAHYLCRVMAAMLRTGEVWRGPMEKKD
jgi:transposase